MLLVVLRLVFLEETTQVVPSLIHLTTVCNFLNLSVLVSESSKQGRVLLERIFVKGFAVYQVGSSKLEECRCCKVGTADSDYFTSCCAHAVKVERMAGGDVWDRI